MSDLIAGSLIILGGVFAVIGALGLVRMPDVLIRMHASTKIGTLSTGLILAGSAVVFASPDIIIRVIAIVLFILLTAPIGAHMMGRSVLSTGVPLWKNEDIAQDEVEDELLQAHDAPEDR
ncbi:monovalent cation/H(+) antiporter subunit G [Marivita sp.]|jgi:multicomponent Na+:H+ antiporter subunit G|uniref:monovalent cation/H(+) antiporter subunit G n=1 Tax=Marivita sp. TaxID=2003365 RepID=UPI003F7234EA